MVYDPGALRAALSAAVGDDRQLIDELRGVFLDSAGMMLVQLHGAGSDADWRFAAMKLHSLAASFGAVTLMDAAALAADGKRGDVTSLRAIEDAICAFDA